MMVAYSEIYRAGFTAGYAEGIRQMENKIRDTEKVLFSLSTSCASCWVAYLSNSASSVNGIPPGFGVEYDYENHRCKVYRQSNPVSTILADRIAEIDKATHVDVINHLCDKLEREVAFTKAELLEALEAYTQSKVT